MLPWYPVPQQLDVRLIHFGVSTYSPATWKKYTLQSQLPKCLLYQSRVTTTALEIKTVQHHWIPKKVLILDWWDLQQLSTTRHFFQAQTVICFPGLRFHDSKPSIHRIPGFPLDLCFCVQDLIVEMLYSDQWQSKENNLFIKWSQDAFLPEENLFFVLLNQGCSRSLRVEAAFSQKSGYLPKRACTNPISLSWVLRFL